MQAISPLELDNVKDLYYVQKRHMADIAQKYGVSIDAVVAFMRRHKLPRRRPWESNKINFERKPLSYSRKIPVTEKDKMLEAMGAMLYWAEGYKKGSWNCVDFANSDPMMVGVFLRFLRSSFVIDESKLRIYLYCYENQNSSELISYWSKICSIPSEQFTKPYVRKDFDPNQKRKMAHGLVHVRYYDKRLLSDIKKMIDSYSLEFS